MWQNATVNTEFMTPYIHDQPLWAEIWSYQWQRRLEWQGIINFVTFNQLFHTTLQRYWQMQHGSVHNF